MANLLPINLIRKTTKDTTINGHFIPKGSSVIPQIGCILYDEEVSTFLVQKVLCLKSIHI